MALLLIAKVIGYTVAIFTPAGTFLFVATKAMNKKQKQTI